MSTTRARYLKLVINCIKFTLHAYKSRWWHQGEILISSCFLYLVINLLLKRLFVLELMVFVGDKIFCAWYHYHNSMNNLLKKLNLSRHSFYLCCTLYSFYPFPLTLTSWLSYLYVLGRCSYYICPPTPKFRPQMPYVYPDWSDHSLIYLSGGPCIIYLTN